MYISTIVGVWYCVPIKCELHIIPFGDENVKFLFFLGVVILTIQLLAHRKRFMSENRRRARGRYPEELKSKVYLLKHFERYRTHCTESTITLLKTSEGRKEWNGYRNI